MKGTGLFDGGGAASGLTVGHGELIIYNLINNSLKDTFMKSEYISASINYTYYFGIGSFGFTGWDPESGKKTFSFIVGGYAFSPPGLDFSGSTSKDPAFDSVFEIKNGVLKNKEDSIRRAARKKMEFGILGKFLNENNIDTLHIESGI